jgi:5-methyltetrahydropteroyltriglutamate--homocysteine methyltransferase
MATTANLGFPRLGTQRELKFALEKYWAKNIPSEELISISVKLRLERWNIQKDHGIEIIPSNDFSWYDHVLDTTWMIGAIPERFKKLEGNIPNLDLYFSMARGYENGTDQIPAMEMTKWFDTNYHYIVPEIEPDQDFYLHDLKPLDEFVEANNSGINTRPVFLGPVSYLLLSKSPDRSYKPIYALWKILPVYCELLSRLAAAGAGWVQIDEPCLVLDLDQSARTAFREAYARLQEVQGLRILLATCFGGLGDNLPLAAKLPVAGLHIDLARAPGQLDDVLSVLPEEKILSLGLVDGRNVWCNDLTASIRMVQHAAGVRGSRNLQIAPSCSLLFSPLDLDLETGLEPEIKPWLAFAYQKLAEVAVINSAINGNEDYAYLRTTIQAMESRKSSNKVIDPGGWARVAQIDETSYQRRSAFTQRKQIQAERLNLPLQPTTTIGSFPQTAVIRRQRNLYSQKKISLETYTSFLEQQIKHDIELQEQLGLDVLVHGESERTDMVEYFAEKLNGFAFTQHGWVQSYGSRAVRPPILFGDVSRPAPMTLAWTNYAQSLTSKPVKGMLTGPITILLWSFVRDDQPRELTCRQIVLALRDEVHDLEASGTRIIQIDEPALREGLPLRAADREKYLDWAVDCFRLVAGVAGDVTQIHTHMCYGEFSDIISAIVRMDADVISIEASRSKMELLETFRQYQYPNDVGPGIYDIHSPRIPSGEEMSDLIRKALQVIPLERLWINPDCGLKTRKWEEVIPALTHMVEAARQIRKVIL